MVLGVSELTKSFGTKQVLKGVNFQTEHGVALGLLGRNGAGKTTIIRILMGVFDADSGEATVNGKPIDRNKIRFGYLPEERGLYPKRVIGPQLQYLGELRGLTSEQAKTRISYWMDRMELPGIQTKKLDTLSKGNQQKIQLAAALLADPQIVILDEPFSGLDPVNAQILKEVVTELVHDGKTVVFSSHQMNYVEEFCDNIAMLHGGKIVLEGNLAAIKRQYERNRVRIRINPAYDERLGALTEKSYVLERSTPGEALVRLSGEGERDGLLQACIEAKLGLECFEVVEPSLEDIFVEKAGVGE